MNEKLLTTSLLQAAFYKVLVSGAIGGNAPHGMFHDFGSRNGQAGLPGVGLAATSL